MEEYSNGYYDNISKHSLNNNYSNLSMNSNHSSIKANLLIEYENLSSNFQNDINNNNNNITSNYYDIENEDFNNDLSSEDEYDNKLSGIKKGILNVKLNIFVNIIQSNLSKKFIFFILKMNYKSKCIKLFLADDNFLYFKLNSKLSDIYKLYAYKKILYVIKKYSYEKFIKNSYLNLWKNNATKNIYKNNIRKNEINTAEFCSKIIHIINNRFERDYTFKYYLNKWNTLLGYSEIKKNNHIKAIFILSNLFNRRIRYFFKIFPRNFLYINSKSKLIKKVNDNNNEVVNEIIKNENIFYHKGLRDFYDKRKKYKDLLKQNKLLNLIKKYDIKNCMNKNILIFFKILKTSTQSHKKKSEEYKKFKNILMDLKLDTMLNAAIMLKIILLAKIKNDIIPYKKIFITKIYCFNRWINLFNYYNKNYLNIDQIINNNCTNKNELNNIKGEINFIRNIYLRAFALEKILIINNRHKFFYSDLNIRLRKSLIEKYFNLWRNITFESYKSENEIKISAIKGIYFILNEIIINKDRKFFYYSLKKMYLNSIYTYKITNCAIIYLYQCIKYYILSKNNKYILNKIQSFSFENNVLNSNNDTLDNSYIFYLTSKKLYFIYKKQKDILKYNYFIKWHNKAHFLSLNNDISKKKKYLLYKFIYTKKYNLLFYYLKKWYKNISNNNKQQNQKINYDNIITELNQLRKENDELIAIYYKRKQEYAKTIYDYQYMKNYYCDKCINEDDIEIDYLSIKSKDIREAGLLFSNNISSNMSRNKINNKEEDSKSKRITSFGNNFRVNEENKLQSNNNSSVMSLSENDDMNSKYGRKLPQCTTGTIFTKNMLNTEAKNEEKKDEGLIKEYQDEFNEQQKYYENYIKILMDKKNELLQMKNMLKNQKKGK